MSSRLAWGAKDFMESLIDSEEKWRNWGRAYLVHVPLAELSRWQCRGREEQFLLGERTLAGMIVGLIEW
jgi:hypothetical protein